MEDSLSSRSGVGGQQPLKGGLHGVWPPTSNNTVTYSVYTIIMEVYFMDIFHNAPCNFMPSHATDAKNGKGFGVPAVNTPYLWLVKGEKNLLIPLLL